MSGLRRGEDVISITTAARVGWVGPQEPVRRRASLDAAVRSGCIAGSHEYPFPVDGG